MLCEDDLMYLDLRVTCNIEIKSISCIGNTGIDGKLNVHFMDGANKRFFCVPSGTSLFLLESSLQYEELKKSLLFESLKPSYSKYCKNKSDISSLIYILVDRDRLQSFLKEVYDIVYKKQKMVFSDLDKYSSYGAALLRMIKSNSLVSNRYFGELEYLEAFCLYLGLTPQVRYVSSCIQRINFRRGADFNNYAALAEVISSTTDIQVKKTRCIGNTGSRGNLIVYTNVNKSNIFSPVPCGTSLFLLKCKLSSRVVNGNPVFKEILSVLKSDSLTYVRNDMVLKAYILVPSVLLQQFLFDVYTSSNSSICKLGSYGKVLLAVPLRNCMLCKEYPFDEEAALKLSIGIEGVRFLAAGELENFISTGNAENNVGYSELQGGKSCTVMNLKVNTLFSNTSAEATRSAKYTNLE